MALLRRNADSPAQTVIYAQGRLWEAANRINARDLVTLLSSSAGARDRVQQVTTQMREKAAQLARDEANIARIVQFATDALNVAGTVIAGDIPGLLTALGDPLGQLSGA